MQRHLRERAAAAATGAGDCGRALIQTPSCCSQDGSSAEKTWRRSDCLKIQNVDGNGADGVKIEARWDAD